MVATTSSTGEGWSSRTAFILAAVGAAVGLGNIWRFPTLAGESGGGAFVIVYIACVFLLGLPLVLSEIFIGRVGQTDAIGSIRRVAAQSQASPGWSVFGAVGALAAFLIVAFYSVVAGWVLYYVGVMGSDLAQAIMAGDPFRGALAGESREQIQQRLGDMFANPGLLLAVHFLFMGLTLYIVARGVSSGIEKAATYLMPVFFVLLVGLVIYGAIEGDIGDAAAFLFTPDWSKLTPEVMNSALGQALFSLSLGVAGLITYGSYIKEGSALGPTAAIIAIADTCVALLAGLMIFPIVFAVGLDPAAGPTLVFQTLPFAFQTMPGGALFGLLFFLLILVAAVTSSISLLEVPTAYGIGERGWEPAQVGPDLRRRCVPDRDRLSAGLQRVVRCPPAGLLGPVRGYRYPRHGRWLHRQGHAARRGAADVDIHRLEGGYELAAYDHRPVAPSVRNLAFPAGVAVPAGRGDHPGHRAVPRHSRRLSAAPPAAEPGPRHCAERTG